MTTYVSAADVKVALSGSEEFAFFDVREQGQFGEGHPFFAVPLPYSALELRLPLLAPRRDVAMVVMDEGDGVAEKAATRAAELGYSSVKVLAGGAPAWQTAGYTLYKGVNLPSKTFGELVEHVRHTPRLSPKEVAAWQTSGKRHVILDGRPISEYEKMNIPGGVCCPNGELALRVSALVPDLETPIIVNCAGRTRSILGAQTLIDAGIENPVFALENGTQGWFLADLELEHGAKRTYPSEIPGGMDERRNRVRSLAASVGAEALSTEAAQALAADQTCTVYLLDVRTAEEFEAGSIPGAIHAPGGQLIQSTDQWIGVRNARIVLIDSDGVRAPMAAYWLRQMGHRADFLDASLTSVRGWVDDERELSTLVRLLPRVSARQFADPIAAQRPRLIDLRPSMEYRKAHIEGADWSIRPRLDRLGLAAHERVVLVCDEPERAAIAAKDLVEMGISDVRCMSDGVAAWRAAGLAVTSSEEPVDADCIDYLFFTHDRHSGNADAARQYLAWEIGLIDQLDEQERGVFRLASA